MPLIWDNFENTDCRISIWKTDEDEDALLTLLGVDSIHTSSTHQIKSEKRRLEILAGRLLLLHQHPDYTELPIRYDANGKPHLHDVPYAISISHTGSYVALITDLKSNTGIDMEILSPRILPIVSKFVSDEEASFLPEKPDLIHYYLLWGAKETVYKMYGKKKLEFKSNLIVQPFEVGDSGSLSLELRLNGESKFYPLNFRIIENLILVYGSE